MLLFSALLANLRCTNTKALDLKQNFTYYTAGRIELAVHNRIHSKSYQYEKWKITCIYCAQGKTWNECVYVFPCVVYISFDDV